MEKKSPGLTFAFGTLIFLAFALLGLFLFGKPASFNGAVISTPLPAPGFQLQNGAAGEFDISDQRGKVVLMFFGYTNCPDFCPTTLATFKQVKESLGNKGADVEYVMVTADPERDSPEVISQYVDRFSPDFIGLSGSREQLQAVWSSYGVFVQKEEGDSTTGYSVSHTASVYVIDRAGNLRMTFPYGTTVQDMTEDVLRLLKEKSS